MNTEVLHTEVCAAAQERLALILSTLSNAKAEAVTTVPLAGKTTLADFMVISSGRSHRHVGAIAAHVLEALAKCGIKDVRVEGRPACDWVLIDAGDVILHIFHPEARGFYNLEKMWSPERPREQSAA